MNSTSRNLKFLAFLFLLGIVACDTKPDERNNIVAGKWFIASAEREGTPIASLEGTVFEFTPTGNLQTNVPQIGNGTYSFNGDMIVQKSNSAIEYKIIHLTADSLVLSTKIKEMMFNLNFTRDSLHTTWYKD